MSTSPINRVREAREARGLSQVTLAARAELTRQSIGAIEAGRAMPGVDVALRIAKALDMRVEELFALEASSSTPLSAEPAQVPTSGRVVLAQVGGRWVSHTLSGRGITTSADGLVIRQAGKRVEIDAVRPVADAQNNFLLQGCAAALGLLADRLNVGHGHGRFVWLGNSSTEALRALGKSQVHVAGVHLVDGRSGEHNVVDVRRHVGSLRVALITLGRWEAGLVLASGNPKSIRSAADLGRRGLCIVTREQGSGARRLLDRELDRAGVATPDGKSGKNAKALSRMLQASGHLEVAQAVALGAADAGVATRDAAIAFGLDFIPLAEERYDLVLPIDLLSDARVQRMLDVLTGSGFRRELSSLGYDVSASGNCIAEIHAA